MICNFINKYHNIHLHIKVLLYFHYAVTVYTFITMACPF